MRCESRHRSDRIARHRDGATALRDIGGNQRRQRDEPQSFARLPKKLAPTQLRRIGGEGELVHGVTFQFAVKRLWSWHRVEVLQSR